MRGVKDERLAAAELMAEELRQPRVPALGHSGCEVYRCFLFGVVIDVEVRCRHHPEVEPLVLDLVSPEVLSGGDRRQRKRSCQYCEEE
jgi:hypothetical protein